ncbi:hypothetical protein F5X68DRAFT_197358, partial [Plectosphaerella plurivora]
FQLRSDCLVFLVAQGMFFLQGLQLRDECLAFLVAQGMFFPQGLQPRLQLVDIDGWLLLALRLVLFKPGFRVRFHLVDVWVVIVVVCLFN